MSLLGDVNDGSNRLHMSLGKGQDSRGCRYGMLQEWFQIWCLRQTGSKPLSFKESDKESERDNQSGLYTGFPSSCSLISSLTTAKELAIVEAMRRAG
jgi:hypothetical protein